MSNSETESYPRFTAYLPDIEISEGKYRLRFAQNGVELDTVLKLRFDIFNLELGEGLDSSYVSGRDEDEFDVNCHHLLVWNTATNEAIGTYRMQTLEMAGSVGQFYSASEFDLSRLPAAVVQQSVELGRACVAQEYRNIQVLYLLWRGLAQYLAHNHKRYLFGCCSLTSQDPSEGKRVMDYLTAQRHIHPEYKIVPQPQYVCYGEDFSVNETQGVKIPRLMKIYLMIGAKICGPPALDRRFKTIDYLTMFDVQAMDEKTMNYFFR